MSRKSKRGQALKDAAPNLSLSPASTGPQHKPVARGARGTEYSPRNPMHDTEPFGQEEGRDPIRTRLLLKGVR